MNWFVRKASNPDNGRQSALTPAEKLKAYYDLAKVGSPSMA